MDILTVIPARMAATRLPGKPLADIGGRPMVVRVWERAKQAGVGEVVVACAEAEIAEAVVRAGGVAVMTDPDLPSGSDRVHQAVERYDYHKPPRIVVNLQGDLPTIEPRLIQEVVAPFEKDKESRIDMVTLVAPAAESERDNPNVVKAAWTGDGTRSFGRALYFSRAALPHGAGACWHHIGIYAYRWEALKRFVTLPPSALERREKLEQLRALEAGMHIEVVKVDTVPLGVDTEEDLKKARRMMHGRD